MSFLTRVALNAIGTVFVALGVLGVFLPLLPATPFLLLAAACYVRGSERLYKWLTSNRYLGPYIKNIRERRGIPRRAKGFSIVLMWGSILFSASQLPSPGIRYLLVGIAIGVTVLILRLKTVPEED